MTMQAEIAKTVGMIVIQVPKRSPCANQDLRPQKQ